MKKKTLTFQQFIYILLAVAFIYAVFSYRDQLTETAEVIRKGIWYLVLLTIFILAGALYNQAALYASLYEIFELPPEKKRLLPLYPVCDGCSPQWGIVRMGTVYPGCTKAGFRRRDGADRQLSLHDPVVQCLFIVSLSRAISPFPGSRSRMVRNQRSDPVIDN
jgi:hypothetical protein